jgi:hypothetical protein
MDEDMSNLYTPIKDGIAQANHNQANLKGAVRTLISQAINCEFPQDDIVEMMQTTMRKPAE